MKLEKPRTSEVMLVTSTLADYLSPREIEVLRLITNARSNQQIANTLFLGMNTVKSHIRSAYRRIGVTTRTQAVLWGVHHGLLDGYDVVPSDGNHSSLRAV